MCVWREKEREGLDTDIEGWKSVWQFWRNVAEELSLACMPASQDVQGLHHRVVTRRRTMPTQSLRVQHVE